MITYLKSETERLEKGCGQKITHYPKVETEFFSGNITNIYTCREDRLCPTCQAKLSTLIKTSWIFARKFEKRFSKYTDTEGCGCCSHGDHSNLGFEIQFELEEIISYCEAKAKEHKIELNSQRVTDNQNKVQNPSSAGSQKTADTLRGLEDDILVSLNGKERKGMSSMGIKVNDYINLEDRE